MLNYQRLYNQWEWKLQFFLIKALWSDHIPHPACAPARNPGTNDLWETPTGRIVKFDPLVIPIPWFPKFLIQSWLVGGTPIPLKNMKVGWDYYSQLNGKKKCSKPPTRWNCIYILKKKTCHSNCNFPENSMTQIIMGLISRVVIKNIPVLLDIRPSPVGSG